MGSVDLHALHGGNLAYSIGKAQQQHRQQAAQHQPDVNNVKAFSHVS